tara:strand:- start:41 stop:697 length:657 start_codon:yes stop_codon:yes gene_type:complete
MAYIPLNKIKTNQYTKGNEFVIKSNNTNYIGFYYILYNGKFFTGKTPNNPPNIEIIKSSAMMDDVWEKTSKGVIFTQYAENYDGPIAGTDQYQNMNDIINYNIIKTTELSSTFLTPNIFYPQPTEDDYTLGSFVRYFCVKVNEDNYLEIDSKTFKSLINQDKSWSWELYTPFNIQWTLTGNISRVDITNKNITLLMERRLKRVGFQSFLKYNFIKHFQ